MNGLLKRMKKKNCRPSTSWLIRPVFLSLLTLVMTEVAGANPEPDPSKMMTKSLYENEGKQLPYRWIKVGQGKNPALVLFLHGAGERGSDNEAQLTHGVGDLIKWLGKKGKSAVVLAPQCQTGVWWADLRGNFRSDEGARLPEKPSFMMDLVFGATDLLLKSEEVDRERVYVTGLSMGGFGSFAAVAYRPDLFAAAMPVCGGGDATTAQRMKGVPFWVFHGEEDKVVPLGSSETMVKALRGAGASVKFRKYPGVGHDSWSATYRDPAVWEWLFAQKKK